MGKLALERILGITSVSNSTFRVHPTTGEVAYVAGCILVLYNIRRQKQMRFFQASAPITSLALSATLVAVGTRGYRPSLFLWDIATGSLKVQAATKHSYGISSLVFVNDGCIVSVGFSHDKQMFAYNIPSRNSSTTTASLNPIAYAKVNQRVLGIASINKSSFVTCGEKHLKFWYLSSGGVADKKEMSLIESRVAVILPAHRDSVFRDVACSGNSVYTITQDGVLAVFNTTSRMMEKWVSLQTPVGYALFVTEQYVVTASSAGTVRMFNATTLEYATTLPLPPPLGKANVLQKAGIDGGTYANATCVAMSGTKVIVAYSDRSVAVYDTKGGIDNVGLCHAMMFHSDVVWDIKTTVADKQVVGENDDGTFATCSRDGTVRIWNLDKFRKRKVVLQNHFPYSRECLGIIYTNLNTTDNAIIPDIEGASTTTSSAVDNGVRSVALCSRNRKIEAVATGDKVGNVKTYDTSVDYKAVTLSATHETHDAEVLSLHYSSTNNSLLASASRDRLVHVFNDSNKLCKTLSHHSAAITCVRFFVHSGTEYIVSCSGDKSMVFCTLKDNSYEIVLTVAPKSTVYDMAVHPSGAYVATAGADKKINIWNFPKGQLRRSYDSSIDAELLAVAFDPSGSYVAAAAHDKTITLHDFYSGDCVARVAGHGELITRLSFSNDGRRVLSVSADGCIFAWRLAPDVTGSIQARLEELTQQKSSVADKKEVLPISTRRQVALEQDPPEPPPSFLKKVMPQKSNDLNSILDDATAAVVTNLMPPAAPVVVAREKLPNWARTASMEEKAEEKLSVAPSKWTQDRREYKNIELDDKEEFVLMDDENDDTESKETSVADKNQLRLLTSPKASVTPTVVNVFKEDYKEASSSLLDSVADKDHNDDDEQQQQQRSRLMYEVVTNKNIVDDELRSSINFSQSTPRISSPSSNTMSGSFEKRLHQQKTLGALDSMRSQLANLGVYKTSDDTTPPSSNNSSCSNSVRGSLSQFTSGYNNTHAVSAIMDSLTVSDSTDLSNVRQSLSSFISGYGESPSPKNPSSRVLLSPERSRVNISLSAFTSGYKNESKSLLSSSAVSEKMEENSTTTAVAAPVVPLVSKSIDGLANVNQSLSNFTAWYNTNTNTEEEVSASLSSFVTGYNSSSTIIDAPLSATTTNTPPSTTDNSIPTTIDTPLSATDTTSSTSDAEEKRGTTIPTEVSVMVKEFDLAINNVLKIYADVSAVLKNKPSSSSLSDQKKEELQRLLATVEESFASASNKIKATSK